MGKNAGFQRLKVLVSACLMVGASLGLCFYCAGVFYEPLSAGLKISIGQASAFTAFVLGFMALSALGIPALLKHVSLHHVLWLGTILCVGCAIGISLSFNRYWLYFFGAIEGIGAGCIGLVPATTLVNNWFVEKKSWITSVILAFGALCGALFTPLLSMAVSGLGWRMSFVVQAVLIALFMTPALGWQIRLVPSKEIRQQEQQIPDLLQKGEAPLSGKTLVILGIIAICSAILMGMPQHFSSMTNSLGRTALLGAQMISLAMVGNIVFKLLGGVLAEKIGSVLTCVILDLFALASSIGLLIGISVPADSSMRVLAFFFGAVYGLNELSVPLLVYNRVRKNRYMSVYAILNCLSTLFTAASIAGIGFFYDVSGSYVWVFALAIALEILILLMAGLMFWDDKNDNMTQTEATKAFISAQREKLREASARRRGAKSARHALEMQTGIAAEEQAKSQTELNRQLTLVEKQPSSSFQIPVADETGDVKTSTQAQKNRENEEEATAKTVNNKK